MRESVSITGQLPSSYTPASAELALGGIPRSAAIRLEEYVRLNGLHLRAVSELQNKLIHFIPVIYMAVDIISSVSLHSCGEMRRIVHLIQP